MSVIEDALRAATEGVWNDQGNPVKGKLAHLVLNVRHDGWQAVAQYWFVKKWNYAIGVDPVQCIRDALAQPIDDTADEPRPSVLDDMVDTSKYADSDAAEFEDLLG